ncbi:hypothetical protein GQ54DRAFT_200497 [Martensiomyces pterosporus]|nr:hypothetical protein GQ54DRAFT_200497 [Martensiomyces pterosporus]
MKIRGLHLISSLLHRVDSGFLRKSGIASLVEQSVLNCLYYRAEEGSLGVELLRAAFQQATAVTAILYPDASDKQFTSRWWSIVDRLISNQAYVSDNVAASRALCEQITPVCKTLGIAATRYLRPLLGVVLQRLNSPVYLSPDICDLHLVLLDQISALINACQPRIHAYVADILAGLAFSWVSAHHRQCAKMKGIGRATL